MSGCDFTSLSTMWPNAGIASVMSAQHSYIVRTTSLGTAISHEECYNILYRAFFPMFDYLHDQMR